MYRRVNSGRFIGATTFGIVIVMAVFTWVMYGMARQVFTMTDVMLELNESFKQMVIVTGEMAGDMHNMSAKMDVMTAEISAMNGNIESLDGSITTMNADIGEMTESVGNMSGAVTSMAVNINRMTHDIGQATYAFSNPMSMMWGNPFPF